MKLSRTFVAAALAAEALAVAPKDLDTDDMGEGIHFHPSVSRQPANLS